MIHFYFRVTFFNHLQIIEFLSYYFSNIEFISAIKKKSELSSFISVEFDKTFLNDTFYFFRY